MVALLPVMGLLFGGSGVIRLRLCYGARSTNTIIIALLVMTSFRLLLVSLINTSSATSMLRFAIYSVCLQFVLFFYWWPRDGYYIYMYDPHHSLHTHRLSPLRTRGYGELDEGGWIARPGNGAPRGGFYVMNSTTLVPPAGMCLLQWATGMLYATISTRYTCLTTDSYYKNLRKADQPITITGVGGSIEATMISDNPNFGTVWYHPKAVANIVSLADMVRHHVVRYDHDKNVFDVNIFRTLMKGYQSSKWNVTTLILEENWEVGDLGEVDNRFLCWGSWWSGETSHHQWHADWKKRKREMKKETKQQARTPSVSFWGIVITRETKR